MAFRPGLSLLLLQSILTAQEEAPTWNTGVAGIVHRSCTPCHHDGTVAPFSLRTHAETQRRRRLVAKVVESRYMPPWLPTRGSGHYVDSRRLEDTDRAQLLAWARGDGPLGPGDEVAAPEYADGWQLEQPALVVRSEDTIQVPADGPDLFLNLVIKIPVEERRLVRAVEMRFTSPAVHHAILAMDRTGQARELAKRTPGPGFPGMDLGPALPPGGHFLGWTPGKVPRPFRAGMAFEVYPGDEFVLQLHLTPRGKIETVRPEIGLHFTKQEPNRRPFAMVLFNEDLYIPAGNKDHRVRDKVVLPAPTRLLGIYPHAHYLGKRIRAWATTPKGEVPIIDIDDWNFDWQDEYRLAKPIALPAGAELWMEVGYDNSADNPRNPSDPPRAVKFGLQSTDEMASVMFQLVPDRPEDHTRLDEAQWRHNVSAKPQDWFSLNALARILVTTNRSQEALPLLEQALKAQPNAVDAWCNLGVALQKLGHPERATRAFREALTILPSHPDAHMNLAALAARAGYPEPAEQHLRSALKARPRSFAAHVNLGLLLIRNGRPKEAIPHFRTAGELKPKRPEVWGNLGAALLDSGDPKKAVAPLEKAIGLRANYFFAWLNLGRTHLALGDAEDAYAALKRAYDLDPDHPALQEFLDRIRK